MIEGSVVGVEANLGAGDIIEDLENPLRKRALT
jgi:hypothetical protein